MSKQIILTVVKRFIALTLLITMLTTMLTACGGSLNKPKNGTYKSEGGLIEQTWTFSGENSITLATGGGLLSSSGTYTISGNKLPVVHRNGKKGAYRQTVLKVI